MLWFQDWATSKSPILRRSFCPGGKLRMSQSQESIQLNLTRQCRIHWAGNMEIFCTSNQALPFFVFRYRIIEKLFYVLKISPENQSN